MKENRAELARRSKLSRSYVSRILRGERVPRLAAAIRLSRVMKITPEHLLRRIRARRTRRHPTA
jgi:transcriptional regulator with XRE-family HTH domain